MSKWVHRLTAIDPQARTATCAECGPTRVRQVGTTKTWRCRRGHRVGRRGSGSGQGYRTGVCPICERETDKLVWDHDHETGKERGWICSRCNGGLGLLGDTAANIEKALAYLIG